MARKLFETDGIRGIYGKYPLTKDMIFRMGKAIPKFSGEGEILTGRDTRANGEEIESVLAAGISSSGGSPVSLGVVPTSAVAYFTEREGAAMGCMITASHNPSKYNGIKFFSGSGMKLSDKEELELEKIVLSDHEKYRKGNSEIEKKDLSGDYVEFLKRTIGRDLDGIKVIVDTANGSYHSIAGRVLKELGAEVKVISKEPDGKNINLECGSTSTPRLSSEVKRSGNCIGTAFDGDGDRVIMIDENGREVNGDDIMGICASHMKENGILKGNGLVGTEYSNIGLETAMMEMGIDFVRAKNGDRYVLEEMLNRGYNLGGEFSGHLIFLDKLKTGDGLLTSIQVLEIMRETGKKLSELAKCMKKYPQVILNTEVREKRDIESMESVRDVIERSKKELGKGGRLLVRYSGTENLLRVMVEGKDKDKIKRIAESIAREARKYIGA